jgi:hypothetical protein
MWYFALTVHTEPFLDPVRIQLLQKACLIYFYGMIDNMAEDFESDLHSMILKLDMESTRIVVWWRRRETLLSWWVKDCI